MYVYIYIYIYISTYTCNSSSRALASPPPLHGRTPSFGRFSVMPPAVFPRSDFACESTTQKCAARAPTCRQNRSQNGCQTRTKPSGGVLEPTFRENVAMSNPSMPAYVCSTSARWQNQRPCCPKINICENTVLNACPENNVQVYQKSCPNDDQKGSRRRPKNIKKSISHSTLGFWTFSC